MAISHNSAMYISLPTKKMDRLRDGKNRVTAHSDRLVLIKKLQNLVYASNEEFLTWYYNEQPIFYNIRSLWEKRHAWAHCYLTRMPI